MYLIIKRIFDFIVSLTVVIILSPLYLIIAILVCLDSQGTPFFKHKRVGKNGRALYIYKFRTMVPNAEAMIKNFTPEQKKEWEENFKLKNDPRITKVGKILRATSLDELPQFFNILKGDMSFVGPRPIIESELRWYSEKKDKFLSVKPGLTGYWASHGRNCIGYPQRCDLELYYVDHASIGLDIKILFKTFVSVFKHEGAM